MTGLLEVKEKLKGFYGKYDIYINPCLKFILALCVFLIINGNIGYMGRLSGLPVALVLALLCSILPVNAMIVLAVVLVIAHLSALSLEVAIMAIVLFLVMFLLYFRFSPKNGFYAILAPVCCHFQLGPVMPMAAGLLGEAYSVISVLCGTIVWFFLAGIKENAAVLGDTSENTAVTSKFTAILNQMIGNKEMYLVLIAFFLVTLVVCFIRQMSIDYAWSVAIVVGALVNFIVLFAGYLLLGISGRIVSLVIGTVGAILLGFVLQFLFFNVDYTRTERVQFEDDEYYYYVKAVPKIYVAEKEKQVKKFATKETQQPVKRKTSVDVQQPVRRKAPADVQQPVKHRASGDTQRITRRQLSEDMDISEDLLR